MNQINPKISTASIFIPVFGYNSLAESITKALNCELGKLDLHSFPDEETLVRIESKIDAKNVIFVGSLDHPNPKIFPIFSAAETARKLGANKVTLVSPYLPYMRQDKSFHEGEAVSSRQFAKLFSLFFDELITMDPHLHRWHSLSEIFQIPTQVLHAEEKIAAWIQSNVKDAILIGPDQESEQWLSRIAEKIKVPYLILEKTRIGDKNVKIAIPNLKSFSNQNPILIDDIISSGTTMIQAVRLLKESSKLLPICITVHGIFADSSYNKLLEAGAGMVVSCNTILHESNQIDVTDVFIESLRSQVYG